MDVAAFGFDSAGLVKHVLLLGHHGTSRRTNVARAGPFWRIGAPSRPALPACRLAAMDA
jgi:hypothetical protein